ncbi:MAG: MMPL family transporter [Myxococcota bacterium]
MHRRIEGSRWAQFVAARPGWVLAAALLLALVSITQLGELRFDARTEGFLPENDPVRVEFNAFRDYFGRSEPVVLAVRLPENLGDRAFLERLRALHRDLENEVPYLSTITSLVNVRHLEAHGDTLHVGELLEEMPRTVEELAAFETTVRASELYTNLVISPDEAWTLVAFETEYEIGEAVDPLSFEPTGADRREMGPGEDADVIAAVHEIVSRHRADGFEIRAGGGILIQNRVTTSLRVDFVRLLFLAMTVITVLLILLFRSLLAALLAVAVVALSLVGTLGCMAVFGAPVGVGSQILPTFLLAVGVGYAVHVLTVFRQKRASGRDRRLAVIAALDHSGKPIVLTAATTVAGLVSFAPAGLIPVAQIGVFAPLGVAFAALYALSLLPALLVLCPLRVPEARSRPSGATARRLVAVGDWALRHRLSVFAALGIVWAAAILGALQLRTSHDPLAWVRNDPELVETTDIVDRHMGGAGVLELLIEAHPGKSLRDPELLAAMDRLESRILDLEVGPLRAAKVLGLHRIVKELHQELHGGDPAWYRVPDDSVLLAQELLLFENGGSEDLEKWVDSTYRVGRMTTRIPWADAYHIVPYAEELQRLARLELGEHADIKLGGLQTLVTRAFVSVNEILIESYLIAFVLVSLMMVVLVGDLRVGLVAMIPNLTPIVVALGFMGWAGIPLGTLTMLVGSIVLGLAVDDTIHMAHGFVRHQRAFGDPQAAIRATLRTTGVALLFTSLALVCGFLVYGFGSLTTMLHFGVIAALSISVALAADLLVLPGLLAWLYEDRSGPAAEAIPIEGWAVDAR